MPLYKAGGGVNPMSTKLEEPSASLSWERVSYSNYDSSWANSSSIICLLDFVDILSLIWIPLFVSGFEFLDGSGERFYCTEIDGSTILIWDYLFIGLSEISSSEL